MPMVTFTLRAVFGKRHMGVCCAVHGFCFLGAGGLRVVEESCEFDCFERRGAYNVRSAVQVLARGNGLEAVGGTGLVVAVTVTVTAAVEAKIGGLENHLEEGVRGEGPFGRYG